MGITINSRILMSAAAIVAAGALIVGATIAFFSDTEESTGNILAAGAIDLGIDNESYYNGAFNNGTSWELSYDLDECDEDEETGDPIPCLFYNFDDLKPGDFGEDTISIHVLNNDAWVCADTTVTADLDNDITEPEDDEGGPEDQDGTTDGDLADEIDIMWWADDGDNVLESDETPIDGPGSLGQAPIGFPVIRTIADSLNNIFSGDPSDPLESLDELGDPDIHYIAKAWCFGTMAPLPITQDGEGNLISPAGDNNVDQVEGTPEDGGFTCTGAEGVSNLSQTDSVELDVAFRAIQSRNNAEFTCEEVE